jgi:hypothetical protein
LFSQSTDSLLIRDSTQTLDSLSAEFVDSTKVPDSLKTFVPVKRDTIVPIRGEPLSEASTIINKRTFLFTNYRYTGDLLRSFSFNFIKDLGFIGQPHETFIYGVGNNGISFLQDGVLWNNRHTNSLDLNLVQSEDIDSIEIVPSPRGFLYGPYNNPVTVNFITKDFVSPEPYSRIKYYEGPNGEAMIDGKFSTQVMKRWNLSFQATNRSVDETYTNSEFGIWLVNAKLKYFLSNSVNISGSYYFVSSNQGLNGGVDFDSLSQISNDPNADLYDPALAPVLYPSRILDVTQHNFNLRTLAKPFDNSMLGLFLYYRYNLDEHRDFEDSLNIMQDQKNKTFGAVLNYCYRYYFLTLQLLGNYEKTDNQSSSQYSVSDYNYERFSIGGILSISTLKDMMELSLFYKHSYWGILDNSYNGMGADIKYTLNKTMYLYAGYSIRDEYWLNKDLPSVEAGASYNKSSLELNLKYFSSETYNYNKWSGGPEYYREYSAEKIKGLSIVLNYKLWLVLLETNTSYYFKVEDEQAKNLPEWQFVGGIYINDLFFEENLDLKAGLRFYYTGKINSFEYYWQDSRVVEPTNKLDFTLAGEIRGAAIFYFTWENLLGNQYYITPYYPMPERNIRFGLAWELFN